MGFRNRRWLLPALLALSLGACGGGNSLIASSGGSGGTGMSGGTGGSGMSTGAITRFGSVFVNGVEYDTTHATITLDGSATPVSQSQLATGMVVTVNGTVNANGTSGTATSVAFTDNLQGIVDSNTVNASSRTGRLVALGQDIHVDKDTVFIGDTGYPTIDTVPAGAVVQVSGYTDGASGTIHAALVRLVSDSWSSGGGQTLELKGVIRGLNTTAETFRIGATLTVDYRSAGSVISNLQNGVYVKVTSTQGYSGSGPTQQLVASNISLANGGKPGVNAPNGTNLTLQGVVTGALSNSQFVLNGQAVQVGSQTSYPNGTSGGIQLDAQLTVHGQLTSQNGALVLVADRITFAPGDSALDTLDGYVEAVTVTANSTNGTLQLMGQTIYVNNDTIFVDDTGAGGQYFNLADIAAGDRVEVDVSDNNGQWLATKVEREATQLPPVWSLLGTVTSVLPAGQFVVAGITVDTSAVSGFSAAKGQSVIVSGTYAGGVLTATNAQ